MASRSSSSGSGGSLGDYFPGVEFDEHGAVGFEFFDGDGEAEVVEEEELEFEVVEFGEGETADLGFHVNFPGLKGLEMEREESTLA